MSKQIIVPGNTGLQLRNILSNNFDEGYLNRFNPELILIQSTDVITDPGWWIADRIYLIMNNHDLGGGTVTLPSNCTLQFEGGFISNGTITGDHSLIIAGRVSVFSTITWAGTFNVDAVYPEWFGAKGNGLTANSITNMTALLASIRLALCAGGLILFGTGHYYLGQGSSDSGGINDITIQGMGKDQTIVEGYNPTSTDYYYGADFMGTTGDFTIKDLWLKYDEYLRVHHRGFMYHYGDNFTAENCRFTSTSRLFLITSITMELVRFINCDFTLGKQTHSWNTISVNCDGATDPFLVIEGCTFEGAKEGGEPILNSILDITVQRALITRNRFYGSCYSGIMNLEDCNGDGIIITDNYINMALGSSDTTPTTRTAIMIGGATLGTTKAVISNNIIYGDPAYTSKGIVQLSGADDCIDSNVVITNNIIKDVTYGIYVSSAYKVPNMLINGNTINNNQVGAENSIVIGTTQVSNTKVVISNNKIDRLVEAGGTIDECFALEFTNNLYTAETSLDSYMLKHYRVVSIVGSNKSLFSGISAFDIWGFRTYNSTTIQDKCIWTDKVTLISDEIDLSDVAYSKIFPIDFSFRWNRIDILYTESSSANAGVAIWVGMWGPNNATIPTVSGYYERLDSHLSLINKIAGYVEKIYTIRNDDQAVDVNASNIAVYCAGGKVGAGKVIIKIEIIPDPRNNFHNYPA